MVNPSAPDILKKIVQTKIDEINLQMQNNDLQMLQACIDKQAPPLNFAGSLWGSEIKIIAEVKKASPVRGIFRKDFDHREIAKIYADNGASAISVLTDEEHFQGSLEYMKDVKEIVISKSIPVLRKDFILDKYQIFQSRAFGADAVLLIVSMLTKEKLQELFELTQSLWMQSIVEIHDETELETALEVGAEIIGINNRNLHNFVTDIEVTEQLAPKIPNGKIIVSESGIKNINDINRIQKAGVNAALIGESLISSKNIATKLKEFIND